MAPRNWSDTSYQNAINSVHSPSSTIMLQPDAETALLSAPSMNNETSEVCQQQPVGLDASSLLQPTQPTPPPLPQRWSLITDQPNDWALLDGEPSQDTGESGPGVGAQLVKALRFLGIWTDINASSVNTGNVDLKEQIDFEYFPRTTISIPPTTSIPNLEGWIRLVTRIWGGEAELELRAAEAREQLDRFAELTSPDGCMEENLLVR
ncbi:unnamed protein product [Protopolystoma xenopodis]|uniref:Uncharacterized protein n=1 Tax=Protopolystoma xenopodis TaxID=117903 RepID=A0A3S5CCX8_9PLAT|nr:unnamed protein product [Protopolystoma xenopodis]